MRQHILDLDSIYGKVYPNKINKQIISITTNKSIAKIVKIEKMTERNALKIYYNVTNKDAKGRKLWFKFRDNQLYCYVDGKIVDKGKQDELLRKSPLYLRMWKSHIGAKSWAISDEKGAI